MPNSLIKFTNGFTIQLLHEGQDFLGLGAVTFDGTPLRSPTLPWTVYTESEQGVRFDTFTLGGVEQTEAGATITFTGTGRWLPRIQDADAMGDARLKARRLQAATATFRWTFTPITEAIAGNAWTGLAMQIQVESPGHPIHWLLEATTWEIGGDAAGCTLIQQDVSTIDLEQTVQADSAFSTIEKFFTDAADAWGGSFPMDMLPRAAGASICDFQVKGDLALCLFSERPSLTRARLEKFADEPVIHYLDRPFFTLTEQASAPVRKLLVYRHAQALQRHEWRNLWLDCFSEVRRRIHAQYGFQLEVPLPTLAAHLWDDDLRAFGPGWVEPLITALPTYHRLGFREVFTHGVWDSVTSDPAHQKDGNICCPYSFRYAEMFGGNAGMKRLMDAAHNEDISIYQWFGMQFSKFSSVWKEHPDWVLREANGDPWDGAYQVLWCGRMRSGFGDYLLQSVKQVKDDTGLDNIFWDSYQNLGVTCVDWQGPEKAPQAEEIWAMQAELQRHGYKQRCEVVTIFGVSQVAMFGFASDKFRRRLWQDTLNEDTAFALLDCSPAFFTDGSPFTADKLNPQYYFWLAGYRAIPNMNARPWGAPKDPEHAGTELPGGELAEDYARVNHLYNAVLPFMYRLRVTEGGRYALWLDGQDHPAVVWAFQDGAVAYTGVVKNLTTGECHTAQDTFTCTAGAVYLLGNHEASVAAQDDKGATASC